MAARRRLMESGLRVRPRLGRFDSNAVRYALTVRPMDRPAAMASLCAVDISRFFFGGIPPSHHTMYVKSNTPFHMHISLTFTQLYVGAMIAWSLSQRSPDQAN